MSGMEFRFRPAIRRDLPLRVLLIGESGDGKTYTALSVAHHLLAEIGQGGRVAVIDSEVKGRDQRARGTAELYAGEHCLCEGCRGQGLAFDFDVLLLPEGSQHPEDYLKAMKAAEVAGYKALVIDSITHAWAALLAQVDALKARNSRADPWLVATPIHRAFVEAIKTYPGHVICTVRSKEKLDHAEKSKGGQYASLGQCPEFRKGIEYEFDVALFMSGARAAIVKTRASALENQTYAKPGAKLARSLVEWAVGAPAETAAKDQGLHEGEDAEIARNIRAARSERSAELQASEPGQRVREELQAGLDAAFEAASRVVHGSTVDYAPDTGPAVRPSPDLPSTVGKCCERDNDGDGNCDRHPAPVAEAAMPAIHVDDHVRAVLDSVLRAFVRIDRLTDPLGNPTALEDERVAVVGLMGSLPERLKAEARTAWTRAWSGQQPAGPACDLACLRAAAEWAGEVLDAGAEGPEQADDLDGLDAAPPPPPAFAAPKGGAR